MNLFQNKLPGQIDAVAKLLELAWYDGLRTGLAVGVFAGLVMGVILTCMVRNKESHS